jgi:hypothetical protein
MSYLDSLRTIHGIVQNQVLKHPVTVRHTNKPNQVQNVEEKLYQLTHAIVSIKSLGTWNMT